MVYTEGNQINWISISGGKDSTALLLWSLEEKLKNCRYIYADTQHEHSEVYRYLDYLESETGVKIERIKSEGFLEMCKRKQRFPSVRARFCTEELKIKPIAKYIDAQEKHDADHPHHIYLGIRREESPARSRLTETVYYGYKYPPRKTSYRLIYHPLLDWYVDDVFEIHRKFGIEPNPLYKKGMSRVGCFPCIMARRSELKKMFKLFPEIVDKIECWEKEVAAHSRLKAATFFSTSDLPAGLPPGIRAFAGYLDDGPELPGLEEELDGCSSIYGLCE